MLYPMGLGYLRQSLYDYLAGVVKWAPMLVSAEVMSVAI
jgi:hypothetical protein